MTLGLKSLKGPLSIHRRVMASPSTYEGWSREDLISRLSELEHWSTHPKQRPPSPKPRIKKTFDFTTHARRKIALKFCYSGWEYGGLAFQNMKTTLPTVEGVLFDAMAKAKLVDAAGGFDGCGWEKCGRTDRGVSAAGQVISLWIRSALGSGGDQTRMTQPGSSMAEDRPAHTTSPPTSPEGVDGGKIPGLEFGFDEGDLDVPPSNSSLRSPPRLEHDYLSMINRLLPPTIRILAWSPVLDTFSARFSCTFRHYKYFFSINTLPGPGLDIDRMRAAASRLIGEHDFRNLCKLDPAKQITMFRRKVMRADIEPLNGAGDDGMYVFNLIGSAFLYHQVRHIMSILFMVGSGIEDPSVVTSLMNVEGGLEAQADSGDGAIEVVDRKPEYQMADALPLMLWDCGYPEGDLNWLTTPSEDNCISKGNANGNVNGGTDLYQQLHSVYSRSQVYTALNNHFLTAASKFHLPPPSQSVIEIPASATPIKLLIPLGGGTYKRTGQEKYTPLLLRSRLDSVEVTNERWRLGKGFRRNERRKAAEGASDDDLDGNE
ncbi:pseudouridine synthase [Collybia nuda]|uniref:Pseudouridine synthase n=1 Tax=Collybia nuda TaxID=64659 RepID=A0A9P6CDH9_9AGAR|nr:pseudouridine synthase [Collybia nuda]